MIAHETVDQTVHDATNHCPACLGSGYISVIHGTDDCESEPCGCVAFELRVAFDDLIRELHAEGITEPLREPFTLGAVLADLARLLCVEPPAAAKAVLDAVIETKSHV